MGDRTKKAVASLQEVGVAMANGHGAQNGRLSGEEFDEKRLETHIETAWKYLNVPLWAETSFSLRLIVSTPTRALRVTPEVLQEIRAAYRAPRQHASLRLEVDGGQVSKRAFGNMLALHAEELINAPDDLPREARNVLRAHVEGVPDLGDLGCQDGPSLPFLISRIGKRAEGRPMGRRLEWLTLLGLGALDVLFLVILLMSRSPAPAALVSVFLGLSGCGVAAFVREDLLGGYDESDIATDKTLAKAQTAISVVTGLSLALIMRDAQNPLALTVAVAAGLLLAASALVADLLVNHAEAATKL